MIKIVSLAITLCVLQFYLNILDVNRESISEDETKYIVRFPSMLRSICRVQFFFGLFLFLIFLYSLRRGNPTVTVGHLWFSGIYGGLGLVCTAIVSSWKILVEGGELRIRRLFRKERVFQLTDLDQVKAVKGRGIILYSNGEKLLRWIYCVQTLLF